MRADCFTFAPVKHPAVFLKCTHMLTGVHLLTGGFFSALLEELKSYYNIFHEFFFLEKPQTACKSSVSKGAIRRRVSSTAVEQRQPLEKEHTPAQTFSRPSSRGGKAYDKPVQQRNCLQGKIKSHQQRPVQVHGYGDRTALPQPLVKRSLCSGSHLAERGVTGVFTSVSPHVSPSRGKGQRNQQLFTCEAAGF